jgi:uncharacterized protein
VSRLHFDAAKDKANKKKHGISLGRAEDFDFDAALFVVDDREDYGEIRIRAIGFLDGRLHSLVFTQDSRRHPGHQLKEGDKA